MRARIQRSSRSRGRGLRRRRRPRSGGSAATRSRACSRACAPPRSSRTRSARPAWTTSSAARSASRRRRTRSIGLERVDAGAEALRHPPPVRRVDRRVDVHVWNGISPMSSSPAMIIRASQRKMIPRSVELTSFGYQARELRRLVGPAERRERPERRREPRVEDVLVLARARSSRTRAQASGARLGDGQVPVRAVPDRDPVAPPELARDAPGADGLHPVAGRRPCSARGGSGRGRRGRPRSPAQRARSSRTTTAA